MDPVGGRPGRPTQAVNSIIMSGIAPKQNAFKSKITPHKQKSIVKKDGPSWPTGALCLSTMVNPALPLRLITNKGSSQFVV